MFADPEERALCPQRHPAVGGMSELASLWHGPAMGCRTCALGMSSLGGGTMVSLSPQPENILCVAAVGHMVKIIDFGLARRCHLPPLCSVPPLHPPPTPWSHVPAGWGEPQHPLWAVVLAVAAGPTSPWLAQEG